MRHSKFLATKNHFIMVAASNEVGDELWAGHLENKLEGFNPVTTNALGFLVKGSVNTFINTSEESEDWNYYRSGAAPLMLLKNNFIDFGLVSTSNNTLFGSILPKESIFNTHNNVVLKDNVDDRERYMIESQTEESRSIRKKCKSYTKRDVNTFKGIDQEPLNINVIPDSEIEVEIEE